MSHAAKQSQTEMKANRISTREHTPDSRAEQAGGKLLDVEGRIEEQEDAKVAALEHDEEAREDNDVNRAAKNNAVKTNEPRG
jgi:hypothetical protein